MQTTEVLMANEVIRVENVFFDTDLMKSLFNNCAGLAKTTFLKRELQGKPEAILSIVLMARELNIPPMTALTKMHFIQGQPTLPSILKLALAKKALPQMKIDIDMNWDKQEVTVTGWRDNDSIPYTTTWDMARAAAMGLSNRDQYKKQAMTMFRHRATSEVIDVIAGDVLFGIHSTEEFQDFDGKVVEVNHLNKEIEQYEDSEKEEHPEWYEIGPFFKIWHGKWANTQLKDHDVLEIEEEADRLRDLKNPKGWQVKLHSDLRTYLMEYDEKHKPIIEIEYEQQSTGL